MNRRHTPRTDPSCTSSIKAAFSAAVIAWFVITSPGLHAADHFVPTSVSTVTPTYNGGISPGDTITLEAGNRGPLVIQDLQGTSSAGGRIVIRNDASGSGPVVIDGLNQNIAALQLINVAYVTVDGSAKPGLTYGVRITSSVSGQNSALRFRGPSRFGTVRFVEIDGQSKVKVGFSINDKSVSQSAYPGHSVEGFKFEYNYVHDVLTEGMYLGNNQNSCGPNNNEACAPVRNLEVAYNLIEDCGWDGIDVKSAPDGNGSNRVHHNVIRRVGTIGSGSGQRSGIQATQEAIMDVYGNWVEDAGHNGISLGGPYSGSGAADIYNNIVVDPGSNPDPNKPYAPRGIHATSAFTAVTAYNNTIIRPPGTGIHISASTGPIRDNIIVDAGGSPVSGSNLVNNRSGTMAEMAFVDPPANDFHLTTASPARNSGSASGFPPSDFDGVARPQESEADQGAFEYSAGGGGSCITAQTHQVWVDSGLANQTGSFTVEFDSTPFASGMDGVVGLSDGAASGYSDLAANIRFSTAGYIDARNGGVYPASSISYLSGVTYHFRLAVNLAAHTYSIYVTPSGGSEQTVGIDYNFRTSQAGVTQLNNLGSTAQNGNSLETCNIILGSGTPPEIATTVLPSGRTTVSYGNQQLAATGGTTPYSWSLAGGTLPAGLSLSSGGVISGTPTTAGTSNFTARVTDSATQSDDQPLSIAINQNSIPDITTSSLPGGTVGVDYNESISSTGGDIALAWSVLSGTLPPGLALSNVNSQNATISGTPTTAGASSFTLELADVDADSDTQALGIGVAEILSATFTSVAAEDGRVRESGENTDVGGGTKATDHWIGDNGSRHQVKLIVSFDTSSLPDAATIQTATLRLRRLSVTGSDPFTWGGECRVDIRNGGFHGSVALQNQDFEASASSTNVTQMSNPANDGSWSTGTINASGRGQINKTGTTQLRVYFAVDDNNNSTPDQIWFYGGEAATNSKPELVITYQ